MGTTVQSVERAFSILESFDERHPARTAADIAETAGLARPTTYRMLQTLRRLGYVTTEWRASPEGRRRQYYLLMPDGRAALG